MNDRKIVHWGTAAVPVLALVLVLAWAAPAQATYVPWDALTGDSWVIPAGANPPTPRISMYPANSHSYPVGFDVANAGKARGLNALQFLYGGQSTGHLASTAQSGSFQIINSGGAGGGGRTFADLLVLVAIDAPSLGSGFSMSLGQDGHALYTVNPASDFAYYNPSGYSTGRPTGYYSASLPTGDGIAYDFSKGMVTVIALSGANIGPSGTVQVDYSFSSLPGQAVFSVYGYDASIGWIYHTNRAVADQRDPTKPLSTFEVEAPPPPPVPEPLTVVTLAMALAACGLAAADGVRPSAATRSP